MSKTLILFGLLLVCAAPQAAWASSLRCGSRLLSRGDLALELESRCGTPDFVASRRLLSGGAVGIVGFGAHASTTYDVLETWIYHADGGRMARFVDVRRGKIDTIRVVNIRMVDDPTRCERALHTGRASIGEARIACGMPMDASQWEEEHVSMPYRGVGARRLITYERWVYDLGPGRFLRILNFENNQLVSVENGRRGRNSAH